MRSGVYGKMKLITPRPRVFDVQSAIAYLGLHGEPHAGNGRSSSRLHSRVSIVPFGGIVKLGFSEENVGFQAESVGEDLVLSSDEDSGSSRY